VNKVEKVPSKTKGRRCRLAIMMDGMDLPENSCDFVLAKEFIIAANQGFFG
jgi:hypothetical protein